MKAEGYHILKENMFLWMDYETMIQHSPLKSVKQGKR